MTRSRGLLKTVLCAGMVACVALGEQAMAASLYLSDYLGVPSGSFVTTSNAPYTTVIAHSHGFGADSPGSFAISSIDFADTAPFAKGIGAHPLENAETRIDFDLDALRGDGLIFDTFVAQVGIDQPTGGNQGARFNVYLNGVLTQSVVVEFVGAASVALEVALGGATTLGLGTERIGFFNGNHAAWADARLAAMQPVPLPGAAVLFVPAMFALGRRRARR